MDPRTLVSADGLVDLDAVRNLLSSSSSSSPEHARVATPQAPSKSAKQHAGTDGLVGAERPSPPSTEIDRRIEAIRHTNAREASKYSKRAGKGDDTAGPKWYGMPKQELDDNTKRELHVLRLRNVLDPKRHYRSTGGLTKAANPKYFQIGQVVPSIFDRESSGRGSDGLFGSILRDQSRRSEFRQRYEKLQSSRKPHARTAGLKKRHKK